MYVKPATPLTVGGVLDDAIKLYRASFRACLIIALIGAIAMLAASMWMMVQAVGLSASILSATRGGGTPDLHTMLPQLLGTFSQMTKSYLVVGLVSLIVFAAVFAQTSQIHRGEAPLGVGDAFVRALRRLPGLILGSFIFTAAVWIGLFLLFIPGVYLWGKLEFWFAAIFADDTGAIDGLGRSWNATVGNWWRSVTVISIAIIMIVVLLIMVYLVFGALVGMPLMFTHPTGLDWRLALPMLLGGLLRVIMLPMYAAVMLSTYHDMKLRREGADLASRAQALQSAQGV
ncbi:MAG TPA: hypothetical protein VHZ99_08525 [Steroidobacteraceae bacterium]|jgi:hypothetical protein|nr:hypothetical protein [Steroidobacteraceae bacterium]